MKNLGVIFLLLFSLIKGMEARAGSSPTCRARMEVKPPMDSGVTQASAPPHSITSA